MQFYFTFTAAMLLAVSGLVSEAGVSPLRKLRSEATPIEWDPHYLFGEPDRSVVNAPRDKHLQKGR